MSLMSVVMLSVFRYCILGLDCMIVDISRKVNGWTEEQEDGEAGCHVGLITRIDVVGLGKELGGKRDAAVETAIHFN